MEEEQKPTDVFPKRLRAARELRGLSQTELAAAAKMPASSIAHFEGGSRKPSFDNLRRLAGVLNVSTDYLLGRTDDPAVAETSDTLYRDFSRLSAEDRELTEDFIEMLKARRKKEPGAS
jgi:transcriptional regulator with XRE-family HTH domain